MGAVAKLGIDPSALFAGCPPFEALRAMAEQAPATACSADEFAEWCRETAAGKREPAVEAPTVESVAELLREFIARHATESPSVCYCASYFCAICDRLQATRQSTCGSRHWLPLNAIRVCRLVVWDYTSQGR
jgi:hypothetical protein